MRAASLLLALLAAGGAPAKGAAPPAGGNGREGVAPFELALVTVNDRPITRSYLALRVVPQLKKLAKLRAERKRLGLWTGRDEEAYRHAPAALQRRAVRSVVFGEILRQEAEKLTKLGFGVSERQVEGHFRRLLKQAGGAAQLAREQGLSVQALKELARDDLLAEAYRHNLRLQLAQPTPQEVADYYKYNTSRLRRPESVRARVIYVRRFFFERSGLLTERKNARKRAEEILAMLKRGEPFGKVARRYSEDPETAAQGGLLGSSKEGHLVKRGKFKKALDEALFGTKPGELSGVVESPENYYIVQVLKHFPEGALPLEEIEEQVFRKCYQERVRRAEEKLFRDNYHKVLVRDAEGRPIPLERVWPQRRPAPPPVQ